ncbi:hypothetical protein NGM37_11530, partial [Streptomyces sp. TRM76130]|nr:hypothetical protein [Streptomyces sp. TRM76130]
AELRTALDLSEEIPIMECDVRRRASSRDVLLTLMRYLHSLSMTGRSPDRRTPPAAPLAAAQTSD